MTVNPLSHRSWHLISYTTSRPFLTCLVQLYMQRVFEKEKRRKAEEAAREQ